MADKIVNIKYNPTIEEQDKSKTLRAGGFLWKTFAHNYPVFSKQLTGTKFKYITGLEPDDVPEDQKEEIKQVRKELEDYYGVSLDPFNHDFWKNISLEIAKQNIFLNITQNPKDKLIYYIIKGGGIFEVASTYEEAFANSTQKKFYMVEPEEFADISAKDDRTINKAIGKLEVLDEERTYDEMFLVHKVLVNADRGTTKQTPKSILYKDLSDFINGKLVKDTKRRTPKQFIETYDLIKDNKKKLYITAYVKDANYFNFLTVTEDNNFQNIQTKTKYGTTLEKVAEFLSNPAHQSELENIKERVEAKWTE